MIHCNCPECTRDRELLESMRELLPLLMMLARAEVQAATTISKKWKELGGEASFREMIEKRKNDIIPVERMTVNVG